MNRPALTLLALLSLARQAWADLEINALRINRGLRHEAD